MLLSKLKTVAALVAATLVMSASGWFALQAAADKSTEAPADTSARTAAEQFARTHALIKPQPGESKWAEIPWLLSVYEARKKAAAEGKPIFIWAGGGAPPIGIC